MSRLQLHEDIRPLSEFRANAAGFVQQVRDTKRPLVITQHGRSAAVLLDVSEYEALLSRLELLTEIQTAEQQLAAGQGQDHLSVQQRLLAEVGE